MAGLGFANWSFLFCGCLAFRFAHAADWSQFRGPHGSGITNRPSHLIAKVDTILAWFKKYSDEGEKGNEG